MHPIVKQVISWGSKNAPEILKWTAVGGVVVSNVISAKQSIKAHDIIDEMKMQKAELEEPVRKRDIVKATWKYWVPVAIVDGVIIFSILKGNAIHAKRNAALAAAYTLSQTSLTEFKEKTRKLIGEKKTTKITDEIAEGRVAKNPPKDNQVYITGKGDQLIYDCASGRYFESNIEDIKRAVNELNKDMLTDMYCSLNDFYYAIGLKATDLGGDLGWNVNEEGLIDIQYTAMLTEDGRPCIAMSYTVAPRYDYTRLP